MATVKTLKIPKRVAIEDLRRVIGDKATEQALTALFGPKMVATPEPIRIEKGTFERVLALTQGEKIPGMMVIPAAIRLYWRESPHAKNRFAYWLRTKIAEVEAFEKGETKELGSELWMMRAPNPVAHNPRKRRKQHPEARVLGEAPDNYVS